MKLQIYNTLAREKQDFEPLMEEWKKDYVGIYSCGPTVYDKPHIGNLRATFTTDLIRNTIQNILWYPTKCVSNITDVGHLVSDDDTGEDKMEKWSKKYNMSAWEVAKKYENTYRNYMSKLNIKEFDYMPRATEHIQEQIDLVKKLEEKWYTYEIKWDGVYMDTSKIEDYGKLLGPNYKKHLEWQQSWARVQNDKKKNSTDFALWKFSPKDKERQMEWESPWAEESFPWWHVECSAMSSKYLGEQFDIHHGGVEHIPVHHSAEIAQSECAFETKPWVKYWLHHQWLRFDWKKASKSSGNTVYLEDIENKGYSPIDLRRVYFETNYRKYLDFSWDKLEKAYKTRQNWLSKISELFREVEQDFEMNFLDVNYYYRFDNRYIKTEFGSNFLKTAIKSLLDDFNTASFFADINVYLKEVLSEDKDIMKIKDFLKVVFWLDEKLLRLNLYKDMIFMLNKQDLDSNPVPENIKEMAEQRWTAKQNKNYEKADDIREKLKSKGYIIKDQQDSYKIKLK